MDFSSCITFVNSVSRSTIVCKECESQLKGQKKNTPEKIRFLLIVSWKL